MKPADLSVIWPAGLVLAGHIIYWVGSYLAMRRRRPRYNEDTLCGCKVCTHLERNKKEWYCKVCDGWFTRYEDMNAVRENHAETRAHITCQEDKNIAEMFGPNRIGTVIHRHGVTAEQLRKRGFEWRSTVYDAWYGPSDEETERVTRAIEKYLSSERRPLVYKAAFAYEECWNAIVCMLEIEADNAELYDIWVDFYLKVKRGEYES